ncbi:bifunctional phosphopantothenoylcysteine decarboxylase/phosphopantothenate--cysteine ligase CoaBC [Clostridium kluyveri]|uniref:bifunctional phosphopantothenoylcysteine decarboxylase/phosphopantothenate--cysteine ligase CoaBC n=1 Tax=Clostridium kluyveri TaxID=1534 RepID=UPI00224823B1|nr:bifunctional phosphopantothenoylcysteine decarboxylase/phosphopantothenate--cysteine ligase CoaBC [Clostridium kluyveri]UZQ51053.1 bifunctional phosphopantothenoylcysteine decarboxylase/phosphopantothenate--cysteine ligase CoaBC [Clostridium kluyveri]
MMKGEKKNLVIGVTGGIAVYKSLDVISKLKKKDFQIKVIMTKAAAEFVTPLSFQTLSQNIVNIDMFCEPEAWDIQHISLAKEADLMAIIPATANIIGKVSNGIADDLLTTTIMATKAPVVFAPAMNTNMYNNPIVQDNINRLRKLGYEFIEPSTGKLACGDVGTGKLENTDSIVQVIENMLYDIKDLRGKKVVVTAGPTREDLDPVRYITNKSSGKMGYAVAEEARDRGAEVTLISGPTNIEVPFGVNFIGVSTNEEMLNAVLKDFDKQDIIVKAAAVCDYKPKIYSDKKIKKNENEFLLPLVKDIDILKRLGQLKDKQILVGFAAESNDLLENAEKKLKAKNLDYIVANDITGSDIGFSSDDNKVTILFNNGDKVSLDKMNKRQVARRIFDIIMSR